jgi:hypothetical protein
VSLALVLARALLALVFLMAGLATLGDLTRSRQALRNVGMPAGPAAALGVALPVAAVAVAVALVPAATVWWGALGALVLQLGLLAYLFVRQGRLLLRIEAMEDELAAHGMAVTAAPGASAAAGRGAVPGAGGPDAGTPPDARRNGGHGHGHVTVRPGRNPAPG